MARYSKSSTEQQPVRVTPEKVRGESEENVQRACLVDAKEISQLTGIPLSTIYKSCRDGSTPHYRLGRAVRFDPDEVLASMRKDAEGVVEEYHQGQIEAELRILEIWGGEQDAN